MRRVRLSAAISLDGYIADREGGYDWIVMDPEIDFAELFKGYDTVLMGRKSYEMAVAQGGMGMKGMKTWVFSRTLAQMDAPDVTVSADPRATVTTLKKMKGKDIWLFGGGELFRSMLELKLVDEIEVAIVPVLLGDGLPLLPKTEARVKLVLTKHRVYAKTGTVLMNYDVRYPAARKKAAR